MKEKWIIVTGAGSGIGKEIVKECVSEGYSVIACDINDGALKQLAEDTKGHIETHVVDVKKGKDVKDLFYQIKDKNLYGLVNNAGVYLGKNLLDYEENEIDFVMDINIKGYVYFSKYFGELLMKKETEGAIINISSVSGMEGSSDAIYGMSKAAILGLTKSCAMNFSPYIRVNAVAPTMVNTDMMKNIPEWRKNEYIAHQLIPSFVTPQDVADTVLFLLSPQAKHYTGATFDLNSGCYLR
ncbi:SDR family oxidoreductase [Priestia megaterium]|uniref:SDR family NAD(P)-dependent oxidoreductase n=1 Tax=Priestia megaterium TaxID=1404 RepID=UPI002E1F4108|nr:SDR family NAD(P)-dependent oxidoreductase [Priestia megaterium]